mmetsp:Transcript_83557/g.147745  ORF Transcript_83557/g.147745 Transcript_83557/m.147745 type:complete len:352 (-) Transcript_83557:165-1220(-)
MGEPPNSASRLLPPEATGAGAIPGQSKASGDLSGFPDQNAAGKGPYDACQAGVEQCEAAVAGGSGGNQWHYAGGGKGGYEMVETLVYVGEGKGTYNKQAPPPQEKPPTVKISWQRRLYMTTLVLFLSAGILSLIASLVLGPKKATSHPSSTGASAAAAPPVPVSPGSRTDPRHDGFLGPVQSRSKVTQEVHRCDESESKSAEEKQWCCSYKGLGCPEMACKSGLDNWRHAWSPGKKIWCCKHHAVGCIDEVAPAVLPTAVVAPAAPPAPAATPAHAALHSKPTPQPPAKQPADVVAFGGGAAQAPHAKGKESSKPKLAYDCISGKDNWRKGWSEKKQDYCCWHTGTGCPDQ